MRIRPVDPPYDEQLLKWMPPGAPMDPLVLFRTLGVHPELASRMRPLGAKFLGHPSITPGEREVVILRTCERAGCEYEWGVHAAAFDEEPPPEDRRVLLERLVDELHDGDDVSDGAVGGARGGLQLRAAARAAGAARLVPAHRRRGQRDAPAARALGGALRLRGRRGARASRRPRWRRRGCALASVAGAVAAAARERAAGEPQRASRGEDVGGPGRAREDVEHLARELAGPPAARR